MRDSQVFLTQEFFADLRLTQSEHQCQEGGGNLHVPSERSAQVHHFSQVRQEEVKAKKKHVTEVGRWRRHDRRPLLSCREAGRRVCTTFSTYHESVEEENLVTMACGLLLELRTDDRDKTLRSRLTNYSDYSDIDDSSEQHSSSGNDSSDEDEAINDEESISSTGFYGIESISKDALVTPFLPQPIRKPSISLTSTSTTNSSDGVRPAGNVSNSGLTYIDGRGRTVSSQQQGSNSAISFQSPYLSCSSSHDPSAFFVPFEPRPANSLMMLTRSAMMMSSSLNGSVSAWLPFNRKRMQRAVRTFNMPHLVQHLGLKNISASVAGEEAAKKLEEARTVTVRMQDEAESLEGTAILLSRPPADGCRRLMGKQMR